MNYRNKLRGDVCARFLMAGAVLSMAVAACDDNEDRYGLEGSSGSAGSKTGGTSGSGGSSAGTSGSGGSSAGATNDGGVGGDVPTEGGAAGSQTIGGAGGEPGGAAGDAGASVGGAGEGGQGGASNGNVLPVVFGDDFAEGVGFVAFGGSVNDLSVDPTTAHSGAASLKIAVPAGGYTGGALVSATDQDLSAFNAVSFWAKASVAHTLNVVGTGNDATATNPLFVERTPDLTTEWQHFVIPIPSPSKLVAENGLFHFAEGAEAAAYTIWLDDIEYVTANNLGTPVPAIATETRNITVGSTFTVAGTAVGYTIDTVPFTTTVGAAWFDYVSLDEDVATVTDGVVTGAGVGLTTITAELDGVLAAGVITTNVAELTVPLVAAPTPVNLPADVISLFSNAFTNVPVSTWSASWDAADLADVTVATNDTKVYTNLVFAGVEFTAPTIDASAMTHLHVDVWLPVALKFNLKLVDFGADGIYSPLVDDSEAVVEKTGLTTKTWQSLEFALADYTALAARAHLAQMIIGSEAGATVYFDNMYFHK